MTHLLALLCALATAKPTQVYEFVSEEEALLEERSNFRNARQYKRQYQRQYPYFPAPHQPVINLNPYPQAQPPMVMPGPGQKCEQKCVWSYIQQAQICEWYCPRK